MTGKNTPKDIGIKMFVDTDVLKTLLREGRIKYNRRCESTDVVGMSHKEGTIITLVGKTSNDNAKVKITQLKLGEKIHHDGNPIIGSHSWYEQEQEFEFELVSIE